jgi:hypothetical protein
VTDALDWATDSAGVLVETVLDGVPRERRRGQFLGGRVHLARSERPAGVFERADHRSLDSAGAARNLVV